MDLREINWPNNKYYLDNNSSTATATTTTRILAFQGRPEYTPEALTHQARDPPPYGEEYNLANTSDVSLTQLSRPGTSGHLIAWRPDGGGYR